MNNASASARTFEFVTLSGAQAYADGLLQIVESGRYALSLMSVSLEQQLYGTEAFGNAMRNFILQHRRARLRVLLHEPQSAVKDCGRLVELGRSLSSRVEFREVPPEHQKLPQEYFVADETAVLFRSSPDQLESKYYADAPMVARSHLRDFEAIWQRASVARELTALGI